MVKVLLALLTSHCSPLTSTAQQMRYRADFQVSPSVVADTIAIEWTNSQVYVPVTIDGQAYRFLLDTGASQAVAFSDTPMADATPLGSIISHDATGRTATVPVVMLPPVQLGGICLTGLRATVQQRLFRTSSDADGILGFDLVNGGLSMKIDVPARQLILTNRDRFFPKSSAALKYSLNYHVPYVDIMPFGRQRERVLFDTGSRQLFSMNKQHFDEACEDETYRAPAFKLYDFTVEGRSMGRHAIGHHGEEPYGEVAFLQLNNLRLGKTVFSDVHCLTTQGGSHLGASLLNYGSVTFIPRKRQFIFQPDGQLPSPISVANRQLEIAFGADSQGRPQVSLLWEQGEPWQQGFREGDVIEQIDHQPVATLSQFIGWPFLRGREYIFTVCSADGQRRELRWVRLR